jgi:RHH-type proline utilization regulon transcriptional repressor/proline dehydrogenase/delta 1-pyrroline-5-carboxylate dehydrogenase
VVGVQPFGGHGLSGTGPKAGGPLYLRALITQGALTDLPAHLAGRVQIADDPWAEDFAAILFHGETADLRAVNQRATDRTGPIISVYIRAADGDYPQECLVRERAFSINTTAAGGNAHLMMIG